MMEKIDVRGLSCPIPVIKTKKVIDQGAAEILITGNSAVSKENVMKLAKNYGYVITLNLDEGYNWEMQLTK